MTASAGLELGCFNIAYLCEQNPDNIVSDMFERECTWYYYNRSVSDHPKDATSYALNKMGDYYYYNGLNRSDKMNQHLNSDLEKAVDFYISSYMKGEPQV